MQLVAYGAQDVYLTGNPQITFFKVVYRRHTNFAVEAIEQTFNGNIDNSASAARGTCHVARNGDLITNVYLKCDLSGSSLTAGYDVINTVELQIGGTKIDRHYGHWLRVWNDLTGRGDVSSSQTAIVSGSATKNYIPLQFFFCRNPGLALPLIALQYHDVRIEFEFNAAEGDVPTISNAELLVEYIYLDSEERKRFAQASHEYLIEQLQYSPETLIQGAENKVSLNLNHPCKELIWTMSGVELESAQLKLNGHDRMSVQPAMYFQHVQALQHHTSSPSEGTYLYSFALNPEEHQPSGTCNFSRIDNAELHLTTMSGQTDGTGTARVYATNYNVLRIMSGMGGLAYSN